MFQFAADDRCGEVAAGSSRFAAWPEHFLMFRQSIQLWHTTMA